jgi:hypothetical protein
MSAMAIYRKLLTNFAVFRYDIRMQLPGSYVAAFVLSCVVVAAGQNQSAEDLKAVLKAGSVLNDVYSNSHIGLKLKLPQPPCDAKLNTSVNATRPQAIVLNCVHYVQGMGGMYTFTIGVDYATNYPSLESTEQYVRSMRHSLERDPSQHAVQTEQPRRIADLDFVEIVMSSDLQSGGKYYQAGACTRVNQYLLCFEAEAPSADAARALLKLDGKLDLSKNHSK